MPKNIKNLIALTYKVEPFCSSPVSFMRKEAAKYTLKALEMETGLVHVLVHLDAESVRLYRPVRKYELDKAVAQGWTKTKRND